MKYSVPYLRKLCVCVCMHVCLSAKCTINTNTEKNEKKNASECCMLTVINSDVLISGAFICKLARINDNTIVNNLINQSNFISTIKVACSGSPTLRGVNEHRNHKC